MRRRAGLLVLAAPLWACLTPAPIRQEREVWRGEWNARVAAAKSDWENPCATKPFIAWADPFLAGCPEDSESAECAARRAWVDDRVAQCREWAAWQLRNFNQHERTEGTAPSVSID